MDILREPESEANVVNKGCVYGLHLSCFPVNGISLTMSLSFTKVDDVFVFI